MQVLLLLFGLLATLAVHTHHRKGKKRTAHELDKNVRLVAWITYTGMMFGVVLFGVFNSAAIFICFVMIVALIDVTIIFGNGQRLARKRRGRRDALMAQLRSNEVDFSSGAGEELARSIFAEFDNDEGGTINVAEAAALVKEVHPLASTRGAYAYARHHMPDGSGLMRFGMFLEMLIDLQTATFESEAGADTKRLVSVSAVSNKIADKNPLSYIRGSFSHKSLTAKSSTLDSASDA